MLLWGRKTRAEMCGALPVVRGGRLECCGIPWGRPWRGVTFFATTRTLRIDTHTHGEHVYIVVLVSCVVRGGCGADCVTVTPRLTAPDLLFERGAARTREGSRRAVRAHIWEGVLCWEWVCAACVLACWRRRRGLGRVFPVPVPVGPALSGERPPPWGVYTSLTQPRSLVGSVGRLNSGR